MYVQFDGIYWYGLDRPLDVIKESGKLRDNFLVKRYYVDRRQHAWFVARNLKLVRVTDLQAKKLSDGDLRVLLM